ncbi:hypothetical protein [Aeromonas caviae]
MPERLPCGGVFHERAGGWHPIQRKRNRLDHILDINPFPILNEAVKVAQDHTQDCIMDDQILIIDDEDLPQSAPRPAGWKVMIVDDHVQNLKRQAN